MKLIKTLAVALIAAVGLSACHSSKKMAGGKGLYHDLKTGLTMADVSRNGDTVRVVYPELAMFDFGKDQIKESAKPSFVRFAAILIQYPNANITINGYTDNVGTDAINMDLSNRRAVSGHDILTANGIANTRITTMGMGSQHPIMSNGTDAGRQANRRVEFLVYRSGM